MKTRQRVVVIHYHIFKNAGSSVDDALHGYFGDRHGTLEGFAPWDFVSAARVADYLAAHPELSALSSHQARLPLPQLTDTKAIGLLFVRHPIDRFGSIYDFERRDALGSDSPSAMIARTSDLRAYAEWTVSPEGSGVAKNYQVLAIAAIDADMRRAVASRLHLAIAKRRLMQLQAFGIVDRFDESMARYTLLLRQNYPGFQGHYRTSNVSTSRARRLDLRLERLQDQLGGKLFDQLSAANQLDHQLYTLASDAFDRRH